MSKIAFWIKINVHDDGSVTLEGPLDNEVLCKGLLEVAKDRVTEHCKAKGKRGELAERRDGTVDVLRELEAGAFSNELPGVGL